MSARIQRNTQIPPEAIECAATENEKFSCCTYGYGVEVRSKGSKTYKK